MSRRTDRDALRPHRRGTPVTPVPARAAGRASGAGPSRAASRRPTPRAAGPRRPASAEPAPRPRRRRRRGAARLALALLAAVVVAGVVVARALTSTPAEPAAAPAPQPQTVHFVAVGDNLPEIDIAAYADSKAGDVGDGDYDYSPVYEHIRPYVESADLAYVDEETHLGGDDIGPRGYPSFNTTDQMADAIVGCGFDLVASATNHAYDWGYFGATDHSREVWNAQPVAFTGTARSAEEAAQIATVERNGITFALLNYTYGVNGYERSDLPDYAVNFIDKDRIADDVARAREQADVVLVAMHWGTENLMEADDYQKEYAQYLADLGVDVVLGSHPHVIGPMEWVEGKDGNRTLVAYSLGNFVSNHDLPGPKNELEGMMSCDFVRGEDGTVSVQNVVWTPLVMHTDGSSFAVYALKDYTAELAARHPVLSGLDDPVGWLRQTTADVLGDEFVIDDGSTGDAAAGDGATAATAAGA